MVSLTQRLSTRYDSASEPGYSGLIALFVLIGLLLRFYLLARPGHLFGITEYDDGVYFGASFRLIEGVIPYRDFVLVQPPGIAVLLTPIAFISKAIGTAHGLAIARIVTVLTDSASIALVGLILRWRGRIAVGAACAVMALYSPAIASSQTVLLEPYLNFFCLLALYLCFDGSRFRSSYAALFFGGVLFGVAGSIKAWAIVPVLVVLALMVATFNPLGENIRKLSSFAFGVVLGFAFFALPFILLAPKAFLRQVITAQITRVPGQRIDLQFRVREITGADPLIRLFGHAGTVTAVLSLALVVLFVVAVIKILMERSSFTIFASATAVLVCLTLLWPSDFYYHYADFIAPYLAMTIAIAVSAPRLGGFRLRRDHLSRPVFLTSAVLVSFLLVLSFAYESTIGPAPQPKKFSERLFPKGSCVLTDQVSLTLAADRFYPVSQKCPKIVDPFGTALALSGGRTIDGGAGLDPAVVSSWLSALKEAEYVWLSSQSYRRVPSSDSINSYFATNFRALASLGPGLGRVYERIP
ncbi:MAG: phospholipid carrier-dependent glycosyltransferase [Actinomycetota bacterium]|nr:MAG: phospholipid carrier-dependent glycosyltransferase [Actinomycetota bacterium]